MTMDIHVTHAGILLIWRHGSIARMLSTWQVMPSAISLTHFRRDTMILTRYFVHFPVSAMGSAKIRTTTHWLQSQLPLDYC